MPDVPGRFFWAASGRGLLLLLLLSSLLSLDASEGGLRRRPMLKSGIEGLDLKIFLLFLLLIFVFITKRLMFCLLYFQERMNDG